MSDEEYWPDRIIAQLAITYDVRRIREELEQLEPDKKISLDEVIEQIYIYVKDDFAGDHMRDIIVFDPDGEEY